MSEEICVMEFFNGENWVPVFLSETIDGLGAYITQYESRGFKTRYRWYAPSSESSGE